MILRTAAANVRPFGEKDMKTLFITDLDGTLLTKEGRVSAYSRERINRLVKEGMLFSFASARSPASARRAVEGLDLSAPAVLCNGGLIYDFKEERTLRALFVEEELKRRVLAVLDEFGICPFTYGLCDGRERVAWLCGRENAGMERFLSGRRGEARMTPVDTEEALLHCRLFYFKCIGPREQLERAWNVLKCDERLLCIFHQETYQNDFWLEIGPREANKANGVRFLKEFLGCERLVCFGDSSNDSDMFDVCDEKYAVRNADGWLKEKATEVIGYCEEDGVAKWLEQNAPRKL